MATRLVLQSWKEISAHVGRTDRTLQRWERDFGFPVHRPAGKSRSAVIAVVSEIEEWMRAAPVLLRARETSEPRQAMPPSNPDLSLNMQDQPTGPEPIDFAAREPSTGRNGSHIARSLEANKLQLLASIEAQRKLRDEQRILLEEQRSLRRQHRNARLEMKRQLHKLSS